MDAATACAAQALPARPRLWPAAWQQPEAAAAGATVAAGRVARTLAATPQATDTLPALRRCDGDRRREGKRDQASASMNRAARAGK